jgi:lipopolysaccharide export LptBFGC system permease protein LptF
MSHARFARAVVRLAEQALDPATCERVIAPAVADLEHECAAAADRRVLVCARAYWGVIKTIALCVVRDALTDRSRVGRQLAGQIALFVLVLVSIVSIPAWMQTIRLSATHGVRTAVEASLLLVPGTIAMVVPTALLFAVAFLRPRGTGQAPIIPGVFASVLACTGLVFALAMFGVPQANQAYRSIVMKGFFARSGDVPPELRRGLPEMTLPMLNDHIANPPSATESTRALAHRQQRFAIVALVPVTGLLGLSLAGRFRSRMRTLGATLAIFVMYTFALGLGADRYGNPSSWGLWTANAVFFALALLLLRTRAAVQRS